MSAEMRPLALYPWPVEPEVMQLIRDAKAKMDVSYKVIPRPSVAGGGPTLAFGSPPPHLGDAVVLSHPVDAEGVFLALRLVLGEGPVIKTVSAIDTLRNVFGEGVREVSEEKTEATVKFE